MRIMSAAISAVNVEFRTTSRRHNAALSDDRWPDRAAIRYHEASSGNQAAVNSAAVVIDVPGHLNAICVRRIAMVSSNSF